MANIRTHAFKKKTRVLLKKAWLITWDWIGDHARRDLKVVAIISSRRSSRWVQEFIEQRFVDLEYTLSERVAYARNRKKSPYLVELDRLGGVPWHGRMTCGPNPHLYARLVKNLRVVVDAKENEQLEWDEIPRPDDFWKST
jgi:hypothetical protein